MDEYLNKMTQIRHLRGFAYDVIGEHVKNSPWYGRKIYAKRITIVGGCHLWPLTLNQHSREAPLVPVYLHVERRGFCFKTRMILPIILSLHS